ncbi:MAG: FAD-dependent monooxygenase [Deltaproteobacteria bacterium]|nr:FAD-dependent monooxygenase [Deltaproteobacteria bacterium]
MEGLNLTSDVAIVGAGPVGCLTALAFARRGARILLLDANSSVGERLSGEWLHPAALQILESHGVKLPSAESYATGEGYVVFPDDGTEPITLKYPAGLKGRSCEHKSLVLALREAVESHPSIHFISSAQATQIEGNKLHFVDALQGSMKTVTAGQIVGADGRASWVRKQLGHPNGSTKVSLMAGILLEDAELPFEGFGHVVLGGPGPALVFRISPRFLRVCLDVPSRDYNSKAASAYLWNSYSSVLPPSLLPAFQEALQNRPILWAPNQFRSRAFYGQEGTALVGDAVGHFHPLTAVGLTLGFMDGECLARSQSFVEYRKERSALTHVPELLADSLYRVFTRQDKGTVALRSSIYRTWRENPSECERTMRILAGLETDVRQFRKAFLKMMRSAVPGILHHTLVPNQWRSMIASVKGFVEWFKWLRTSTEIPNDSRA